MTELQESLLKCNVRGNVLFLPPMSEGPLSNYAEVRKALLNAGAKYKRNTFVFPGDAQPYIHRLMGGENVNIKKEFQFFETPNDIADHLVKLAEPQTNHTVLEPSAGQGAIVKAINRRLPDMSVYCYELMPENQAVLFRIPTAKFLGPDFLKSNSKGGYDRIIANPPFSKGQDIDHILKMYKCLKPGGRLVSVASPSWTFGTQKKQLGFKSWLSSVNADIQDLEAGTFKESGTNVKACIITIDK